MSPLLKTPLRFPGTYSRSLIFLQETWIAEGFDYLSEGPHIKYSAY